MITKEEFYFISHLSKLNITDSERETLISDMEEILAFAEKIKAVPSQELLESASEETEAYEVLPPFSQCDILKNAPTTDGKYFILPKRSEAL